MAESQTVETARTGGQFHGLKSLPLPVRQHLELDLLDLGQALPLLAEQMSIFSCRFRISSSALRLT